MSIYRDRDTYSCNALYPTYSSSFCCHMVFPGLCANDEGCVWWTLPIRTRVDEINIQWENLQRIRPWPALYWESSGLWNCIIALRQASTRTQIQKTTETFSERSPCALFAIITHIRRSNKQHKNTAGDVSACGNFTFSFTLFLLLVGRINEEVRNFFFF